MNVSLTFHVNKDTVEKLNKIKEAIGESKLDGPFCFNDWVHAPSVCLNDLALCALLLGESLSDITVLKSLDVFPPRPSLFLQA